MSLALHRRELGFHPGGSVESGNAVHWALAVIALTLLAFAAISGRIAGTPITARDGLYCGRFSRRRRNARARRPEAVGKAVKLLAEATLALVLFGDASRINLAALREEVSIPARLLGIGLPLTLIAGFGVGLVLLDALTWPEALLLAVILAPTDAALGQAVVTLPRLPSRVRQGLNVESGLNDGICVPLFLIALAIAQAEAGRSWTDLRRSNYRRADRLRRPRRSARRALLAAQRRRGRRLTQPRRRHLAPGRATGGRRARVRNRRPARRLGFIAAFVGGSCSARSGGGAR